MLRDIAPEGELTGRFLAIDDGPVQLIHIKPADFGDGIVLRLQNFGEEPASARVRIDAVVPKAAWLTSPDERDGKAISVEGAAVTVEVAPRAIQSVRVVF